MGGFAAVRGWGKGNPCLVGVLVATAGAGFSGKAFSLGAGSSDMKRDVNPVIWSPNQEEIAEKLPPRLSFR